MAIDPDVESDRHPLGKAWPCVFNFKTTCSQFQQPSLTAATQGEAELRIIDFKNIWSEFQKPCQIAVTQGKAVLRTYNLKKNITSPESVPSSCVRQHT